MPFTIKKVGDDRCTSRSVSLFLSLCLSVFLFVCLQLYFGLYLSFSISVSFLICVCYLSSVYSLFNLSVISLSVCISVYSLYLSVCTCLSVFLSLCLSICICYLPLCPSVSLSTMSSVYLTSVFLYISLISLHLSIFTCLSVSLSLLFCFHSFQPFSFWRKNATSSSVAPIWLHAWPKQERKPIVSKEGLAKKFARAFE